MMNLKTRYNLWKLKRVAGPSTAFKTGLRKDLSVALDAKYGKARWYQIAVARTATGFTVVTLLLTSGGGVYAYSNPAVTEGSTLYPLKQAIETVEEVTKITPEAKAKFYIKKIERREAEREVLKKKDLLPEIKKEVKDVEQDIKLETKKKVKIEAAERKIQRTEKSIERAEEQLEKARQIMEKTESKNTKLREELKNRLEQRSEKIKKQLEIKTEKQKDRQERIQTRK